MKSIHKYLAISIALFVLVLLLVRMKVFSTSEFSFKSKTPEKFTNLSFSAFDASHNSPENLGNIFKTGELNLKEYPNVEIKPGQQLFQTNKFLPECCFYYSDYSTDKGCPCITPEQQYYLQRRGLNRDKQSFKKGNHYKNLFFSPTNALRGKRDQIFSNHDIYPKKQEEPLSEAKENRIRSKLYEISA